MSAAAPAPVYDVFLSYSEGDPDSAHAHLLLTQLKAAGYSVAVEGLDFLPAQPIQSERERCVRQSRFTVGLVTSRYLESGETESVTLVQQTLDRERRTYSFIPARFDAAVVLPTWMRALTGVDFTSQSPLRAPLERLKDALGAPLSTLAGKEPAPARGTYLSKQLVGRVKDLIGRTPQYDAISAGFAEHSLVVVYGLGGVGKTQVLLGYVHETALFAPDRRYVLSLPSANDLDNELMVLARSQGWIPEAVTEQAKAVEAAWGHLKAQGRVLVALDNVEDTKVVATVRRELPEARVLITQRKPGAFQDAARVEVAVLGKEAGARFLLERAGQSVDDPSEWAAALALSEAMEGLTLALNLAGAYVLESGQGVAHYKELFDTQASELLTYTSDDDTEYKHSVVAAVLLSLEKTKERSEAAAQLVQTVAFFAHAPVPKFLWEAGKEHIPEPLGGQIDGGLKWDKVLIDATRYALVQVDQTDGALTMHRLTHLVLQAWKVLGVSCSEQNQVDKLLANVTLINAAFSTIVKFDWLRFTALFALADATQEWAKVKHQEVAKIATLCDWIAGHLYNQANYNSARALYERALAIRKKALDSEHPDTATSINNLALLYKTQGDYASALPLYKRALAIYKKALGSEHPDTATSLNNLALLYKTLGDYTSALRLYKRALAIREKALGSEHPDTATSLNNLALLYQAQGDYVSALPLYERALVVYEQLLGSEHPTTALILNNMAGLHQIQYDYVSALLLHERALVIHEKTLGSDHPNTATSLNNIAIIYYNHGQIDNAEKYMRRAVAIREKKLGLTHPDTINSCQAMQMILTDMGEIAQAKLWEAKAKAGKQARAKIDGRPVPAA
jgi:tetratricopeptide (TPR) repeat protein